jgi:hypothetical protein
MKCLRCGHCCKRYAVIIVDNPELGVDDIDNLVPHMGTGEPCKHLLGDKPGEYACAVHDYPWYTETPCYRHGQIESDPETPCRMGVYVLSGEGKKER